MIDKRWNYTLHCPIHVAGLCLNPAFSYSYGFRFDAKVMAQFFECAQRMVPSAADSTELSQELELYKGAMGLFGFDIAINDRTNIMLRKLRLVSSFKFHFLFLNSFFVLNFIVFSYISLICCRYLVGELWHKSSYSTEACHSGA